jgi:hypothetical protein
MRKVLALAAVGEAATGLMLIAYPPLVVRLLCGLEVSGSGIILSRIFGISLISLGLACWPANGSSQPLLGMLTYTALATVYLVVFGLGGSAGILLWPAVVLHAVLTVLLGGAWVKQRKTPARVGAYSK